jgi:hypothetical protein
MAVLLSKTIAAGLKVITENGKLTVASPLKQEKFGNSAYFSIKEFPNYKLLQIVIENINPANKDNYLAEKELQEILVFIKNYLKKNNIKITNNDIIQCFITDFHRMDKNIIDHLKNYLAAIKDRIFPKINFEISQILQRP